MKAIVLKTIIKNRNIKKTTSKELANVIWGQMDFIMDIEDKLRKKLKVEKTRG